MIEVKNLVKDYGGHLAVDHLSFTVEDGQQTGKVLEAFSKAFMGGETAEPPFKDFTRGHFKRGVE